MYSILDNRPNRFRFDNDRRILTFNYTISDDGGIYRIDSIRITRIGGIWSIDQVLATSRIELVLICKFSQMYN